MPTKRLQLLTGEGGGGEEEELTDAVWKLPTPLLIRLAYSILISLQHESFITAVHHNRANNGGIDGPASICGCAWIPTVHVRVAYYSCQNKAAKYTCVI